MKIGTWRVEYTITLIIIYTFILLFIPTSIKTTVQAGYITKWKDTYNKINYLQEAILKQEQSDILTSLKSKTPDEREDIIITLIKPYFRLKETKVPRRYKVKYMDKKNIQKDDFYYINEYYFTENNMIVGLKDIDDSDTRDTIFLMTFDINGLLPPNMWGKDVFGVRVHADKVEPIGREMTIEKQYYDCSVNGSGKGCSNFYLIGGDFND